MDRLSELNTAQREAVGTLTGPLLILAGAGSGKTRVITYRMAELIENRVPPEKILSVTFTNKAAREMQQRAGQLLGQLLGKSRLQKPLVCIFKSMCLRILSTENTSLGSTAESTLC